MTVDDESPTISEDTIKEILPDSFFADRPTIDRLVFLVNHWNRSIKSVNELESQLQALKEEGVQLINQVIEGLLHKDDEYQIDFNAQITELREVLNLITNL